MGTIKKWLITNIPILSRFAHRLVKQFLTAADPCYLRLKCQPPPQCLIAYRPDYWLVNREPLPLIERPFCFGEKVTTTASPKTYDLKPMGPDFVLLVLFFLIIGNDKKKDNWKMLTAYWCTRLHVDNCFNSNTSGWILQNCFKDFWRLLRNSFISISIWRSLNKSVTSAVNKDWFGFFLKTS